MTDQQPTSSTARACACLSRRHALTGAATVGLGAPFLVACGGDDPTASDAPASSSGTPSPSDTPTSGDSEGSGGSSPGGLTTTADIPVGGGVVFGDQNVVVVQPSEGDFRGWAAACTHQGCLVSSVEDGVIVCPCHNSTFSIEDGSPQGGPASAPLGEVALTVDGDSISLA